MAMLLNYLCAFPSATTLALVFAKTLAPMVNLYSCFIGNWCHFSRRNAGRATNRSQVLGLQAEDDPAGSHDLSSNKCIRTRVYLHMGFVNYLTWEFWGCFFHCHVSFRCYIFSNPIPNGFRALMEIP